MPAYRVKARACIVTLAAFGQSTSKIQVSTDGGKYLSHRSPQGRWNRQWAAGPQAAGAVITPHLLGLRGHQRVGAGSTAGSALANAFDRQFPDTQPRDHQVLNLAFTQLSPTEAEFANSHLANR